MYGVVLVTENFRVVSLELFLSTNLQPLSLYSGSVMLIQAYGVEDLLTPGCIVACSNLQWKADDGSGVCHCIQVLSC